MTTDTFSMALVELLRKAEFDEHVDVLRESMQLVAQQLMELEVRQHVQADKHERTEDRQGFRNGYRERQWDTRAGTIALQVPRVRDGSYYPSLLEPRRRAEKALVAVVQEAYVHGVSTRKVDDLVKALGLEGISKSQVSRLCADLDAEVQAFRERPLTGPYPYVWLDATYLKVRQDHKSVSMAVGIAIGVGPTGERQILGVDVGPSADSNFWLGFLRSLVARGVSGGQLVSSDAHQGLHAAIGAVVHGAAWQRCRVHWPEPRPHSGANARVRDHPHHFQSARCGDSPRAVAQGRRHLPQPLPQTGGPVGRHGG